MERTQIYLDRQHKEQLQKMAREKGLSMAELVREAVEQYIVREREESIKSIINSKGIWSDRDDIEDSVSYIDEMRKRWDLNTKGTGDNK